MRILFMADVPPDPDSGAAGTEVRTIEALRALGHEVDAVWAPQLGRRIAHGNLHYLLELPRAFRRELAARPPYDVYHVNQPHGFLAAKWVERRRPGGLFVHRSHGLEPHAEEIIARFGGGSKRRIASRVMRALLSRHMRGIARHADGHIVSSSLDRDFLVSRFGVPEERVAVIAQGIPDSYTAPAPPMTAERLRRVLYVGQFAFFKAPDVVADAVRRLADSHELTWVCAKKHHAIVRSLAGENVKLLDWMPARELRDVFDENGVLLFPSYFEGFGKVFLEGMSRGMCVIASDVGGAHDLIEHGIDGVLVPPGHADAVADAVRAIDLPRATGMSRRAAQKASQYTWERVARESVAFYTRLMEQKR